MGLLILEPYTVYLGRDRPPIGPCVGHISCLCVFTSRAGPRTGRMNPNGAAGSLRDWWRCLGASSYAESEGEPARLQPWSVLERDSCAAILQSRLCVQNVIVEVFPAAPAWLLFVCGKALLFCEQLSPGSTQTCVTSRQTVLQAGERREWSLAAAVRVRSQRSEDRVLRPSVRPGHEDGQGIGLTPWKPPPHAYSLLQYQKPRCGSS